MKYPSSSLRPSSILSPTRDIDASPYTVADMTELLAKCKADCDEEDQLLAEAEGLLPQQAPPGPSPVLISAVPMDRGEAAGKAAPLDVPKREIFDKVPGGKCPLCLSKKHKYRAGDYGHKDKNTITQSCSRAQPETEIHVGWCTRLQGRWHPIAGCSLCM